MHKTITNGGVTLLLNAFGKGFECGIVTPNDARYAGNVVAGDVVLFEGSVMGVSLSGPDAGYTGLLPCRLTAKPLRRQ